MNQIIRAAEKLVSKHPVKSCYVHVPFCKKICAYCDFCKNYYDECLVSKYIERLQKEIKDNYQKEKLGTLYVGGGTPSCLSLNNLKKLFRTLSNLKLSDDYEFTFECNYDDITEELLMLLKHNRVNRLSIGLETFNEKYQRILERNINKKQMINAVKLCKKYFDNINVDLMYALPSETLSDLLDDIKTLIKLDVSHVSIYSLIIEEHTKLKILDVKQIDDDVQSKMYYKIVKLLKQNGYVHYELSNFCKPGYESKHNLTYWNNDEYYGFGAGASGFVNQVRYDNTKSVFSYLKGKHKAYQEEIDRDCMIKDEVMLGLRKVKGINKDDFKLKFGKSFNDCFNYKSLIKLGLLEEKNNLVYIPSKMLFVSNEIIIKLLDCYIA